MTVLLVITAPEPGGAQRHVRDLMVGLRHQVGFVLATSGAGWLVEQARSLGIPVIPLDFDRTWLGWRNVTAVFRLVDVIRKHGVMFVHCHSTKAGAIARLAALVARRPCLYTVHGFAFKDRRFPWIARALVLSLEWVIGKVTARMITVTQVDFDLALGLRIVPSSRLDYIANGVDIPEKLPSTRTSSPGVVVGTMARLIKGKGVEELLEAMRLLLPAYPDVTLRVAGDGPWRSTLEARARKLGLQGRVRFLGWVEDVHGFLAGIDIFVLPSWKEGTPYALLDAMAHGKAVVATNVGGIPEMLEHGTAGHIVSPGDVAALAASIASFVVHPERRDKAGRMVQSIVRARFRREEMLRETYAAYVKVSSGSVSELSLSDDSTAELGAIAHARGRASQ